MMIDHSLYPLDKYTSMKFWFHFHGVHKQAKGKKKKKEGGEKKKKNSLTHGPN